MQYSLISTWLSRKQFNKNIPDNRIMGKIYTIEILYRTKDE